VKLYEKPDWAKAFVDLPVVADPGTVGRYCSGGIITAGRVIERVAVKPLPDFAQEASALVKTCAESHSDEETRIIDGRLFNFQSIYRQKNGPAPTQIDRMRPIS